MYPSNPSGFGAYGAKVFWTDPSDGSDEAVRVASKLATDPSDKYFYADQCGNDNNWRAHHHLRAVKQ
jgi:cysteine synthase B